MGSMAMGPPPPEVRQMQSPPSLMMAQGAAMNQPQQQQRPSSTDAKGLADQATMQVKQKLLEYKNVLEDLAAGLKAVRPEALALLLPAVQAGKAIEGELKQMEERAQAGQPNMAGASPMGSGEPQPGGNPAEGMPQAA